MTDSLIKGKVFISGGSVSSGRDAFQELIFFITEKMLEH